MAEWKHAIEILNKMEKLIEKIIDKQFELIGENKRWRDIPKDGMILVSIKGKEKGISWWEMYRFRSEEQYQKWKDWAIDELSKVGREKEMLRLDLLFSFNYPLETEETKKAQLELF